MNAGTDQIKFGAQGVADVDVHLPMVLTDRESSRACFYLCSAHIQKGALPKPGLMHPWVSWGKGFVAGADSGV